jgi:hypothetical protein
MFPSLSATSKVAERSRQPITLSKHVIPDQSSLNRILLFRPSIATKPLSIALSTLKTKILTCIPDKNSAFNACLTSHSKSTHILPSQKKQAHPIRQARLIHNPTHQLTSPKRRNKTARARSSHSPTSSRSPVRSARPSHRSPQTQSPIPPLRCPSRCSRT